MLLLCNIGPNCKASTRHQKPKFMLQIYDTESYRVQVAVFVSGLLDDPLLWAVFLDASRVSEICGGRSIFYSIPVEAEDC